MMEYKKLRVGIDEQQVAEDEVEGRCRTVYERGVIVSAEYDGIVLVHHGRRFVPEDRQATND